MSGNGELFEAFLNQHDGDAWRKVIATLLPHIHEADRAATQIWFAFFPLDLARAFQTAEEPEQLAEDLQMLGKFSLKDQIDSSHSFLYGHRYWPDVKRAITAIATSTGAPLSLDLAAYIRETAGSIAESIKVDASLVLGITAVGFMTLQQAGVEAVMASPGTPVGRRVSSAPDRVLKARNKGDGQGLFGFLKGEHKVFTVTFNENDPDAKFKLVNGQELTTAAADDTRHFADRDPRLLGSVGPIPVQCRAAACGTCWVGVLGGSQKLSDVDRIEGARIKDFGYIDTSDPKPLIRLACRAQAYGAVSIVIPPWNGVFGKFLRHKKTRGEAEESQRV